MPKNSIQTIKDKVFQNSLETCEYVGGYLNANSIIKVKCLIHDCEFDTKYENVRRDSRKHHICPVCQEEDRNSAKVQVKCDYCGEIFLMAASKTDRSKSGLHFCCREHKDLAQSLKAGEKFQEMRPAHYGATSLNYRATAFRAYEHKCAICGWDEDEDVLEVHHIDEDRSNNNEDNLIILCPICHRKLTSHKYNLISREQIVLC